MRDALGKFLIYLTKNRILGTREKAKELAMTPVSNSKSEHQMLSPSCSEKASGIQQHLEDSSAIIVLYMGNYARSKYLN